MQRRPFNSLLMKSGVQVEERLHRLRLFPGPQAHTKQFHKQNYSEHFGKEYDFKCPVHQVPCIWNAKDSAIFPVSSWINLKIGPVTSTENNKLYLLHTLGE